MSAPAIIRLIAPGAIGALGLGSYLYIRGWLRLQRRRARLERHLRRLRRLTSQLLNAFNQLLKGDTPEESVLYQRFSAYGGEYYDDVRSEVHEALHRSQCALEAAFELHHKLNEPAVQEGHSLEQQVWDWEMLLATLIGHSEQLRDLTAEELRALLDPLPASGREIPDVELAEQLRDILWEFTRKPLRFRWRLISPALIESQGVLSYVKQVKEQIARLPERHRKEAPCWLGEVRSQRQKAGRQVPSFLSELHQYIMARAETRYQPVESEAAAGLTGAQLFSDIDARIAHIQAALVAEEYLDVIEQAHKALRDLETVRAFLEAMNDHGRRQAKIDATVAQYYRPPDLFSDLQEIETDVQTVIAHLLAGDYAAAEPWINELNIDSQAALDGAQAWHALHDQNVADLNDLRDTVARLEQWWQGEVAPARAMLETYPPANWADVAESLDQVLPVFHSLRDDQIGETESLNSMEVQKFAAAERMLDYARADLNQVEQQFHAVVNRLAEVRAAESHVVEALRLTRADLDRAAALRDHEDAKIGPEVDRQIAQAGRQLAAARRLAEAREFMAAVDAQTAARQLATAAYMAANEQVREINALQAQLEADASRTQERIERCLAQASELPPVAQTDSTNELSKQLRDKLSRAERARAATSALEDRGLAQGLQTALAAYEEARRLAEWMAAQVTADSQEYQEYLDQTLAALSDAQAAIQEAEQEVHHAVAGSVRRHALRRARLALPPEDATQDATKQALVRLRQQAEESYRSAQEATSDTP